MLQVQPVPGTGGVRQHYRDLPLVPLVDQGCIFFQHHRALDRLTNPFGIRLKVVGYQHRLVGCLDDFLQRLDLGVMENLVAVLSVERPRRYLQQLVDSWMRHPWNQNAKICWQI